MVGAGVWTTVLLVVLAITLLSGFPVALCLAGSALIVSAAAVVLGAFDPSLLMAIPNRIYAAMSNPVLVAVPLFVFMGFTLERSRIAEDLLEDIAQLLGNASGGLAIAVCLVGALLAASTGIVGASVVTLGLLALPTMLRRGYDPAIASGCICAAGTLGQIIPPSIVLILLGDQISSAWQTAQYARGNFSPDAVSINDLFAGALLPGLLLVLFYVVYIVCIARLKPTLMPAKTNLSTHRAARDSANILRLLRSLLPPVLLIIAVLGSILAGVASPTEAASIGAIGALLLADHRLCRQHQKPATFATGILRHSAIIGTCAALLALVVNATTELSLNALSGSQSEQRLLLLMSVLVSLIAIAIGLAMLRLYRFDSSTQASVAEAGANAPVMADIVRRTVSSTSMIFLILIGATIFSLAFRGVGGDELIRELIQSLPGGLPAAVLCVMLVMFILGFFLDFLEIIFIVVPIVAPVLLGMELAPGVYLSPVWLGVMIAINLQTSFLTPPFGFSLFYLRGVAGNEVSTIAMYKGIVPFVAIQLFILILLWFAPQIVTWLPSRLY